MVFGIPWNWPEVFAYCNVIKGNLGVLEYNPSGLYVIVNIRNMKRLSDV